MAQRRLSKDHPIGSLGQWHAQGPPHISDPVWAIYWPHLAESIAVWCPHLDKRRLEKLSNAYPAGFLQNPVVALLLLEDPGWPAVSAARYRVGVHSLERRGFVSPLNDDNDDGAGYGDSRGNGLGSSHASISADFSRTGSGYGDGHCGFGDGSGSGHGDNDLHDEGYGGGKGVHFEDGTGSSYEPPDHGNGDGNGAHPPRRLLV